MAILGNIVKKVVELSITLDSENKEPLTKQMDVLRELINTAKSTSFGQYFGYSEMFQLSDSEMYEQFQNSIPILTYNQINRKWWKQHQKFGNITWPGKQSFYALSSGTTGKSSKRIPVSEEMMDYTRKVSFQLVKSLGSFNLNPTSYEKEVFMLGSSNDLIENKYGFLEGEISGINTYNLPGWFDIFYRPGKDIASINEWDERVAAIVKESVNWDISVIAGIPSWVQVVLKRIITEHNLNSIHDIWPNLELYITGGVPFQPFANSFNELTNEPLKIIDTYLASEGFFGFTDHPDRSDMKLSIDTGVFYEFIPFTNENFKNGKLVKNPQTLTVHEVEVNIDYAMIITTASGLWRYQIGDTLKFTDVKNLRFEITGRTKHFLNVVGSQLSEEKLDIVVKKLSKTKGVGIDHYSVACVEKKSGRFVHQWLIVTDDTLDTANTKSFIDQHLKVANKNYQVARNKALSGVEVVVVKTNKWYDLLKEKGKIGGQAKIPKVMSQEMIEDYLSESI